MIDFDSFDSEFPSPGYSREEATFYASQLVKLQGVVRVMLYGSIARDEAGHDMDLLILVDDEKIYQDFLRRIRGKIEEDIVGHELGPRLRLAAVLELWPNAQHFWPPDTLIDLFVMPQNWMDRLAQIQENLPHEDQQFMHNIAQDARVIASR